MFHRRVWNLLVLCTCLSFFLLFFWGYRAAPAGEGDAGQPNPAPQASPEERPPGPIYKNLTSIKQRPPINNNFPLAGPWTMRGDLPEILSWNRPPSPHIPEKTPLFIGFTRNWPMLQQCVLLYIVSGWPPEDIYVIDNTSSIKSNFPSGKLSLQNPFYLNVHLLMEIFGVNVLSTSTLLAFAQLQNFYIFTALENGWDYFWWSHMDCLALTEERYEEVPFKSLDMRAVNKLREATSPNYLRDPKTGEKPDRAIQFFAYDWLALNVNTFMKIGAWDTFVSYYLTDCDIHSRFGISGIKMPVVDAGRISDVRGSIDLNLLFRRKIDPANTPKSLAELAKLPEDERGGQGFEELTEVIQVQIDFKAHGEEERNTWQYKQQGGQGEPFYRNPQGFEKALQMAIACGVDTYKEKWGHKDCALREAGLGITDAWKVEHDWVDEP